MRKSIGDIFKPYARFAELLVLVAAMAVAPLSALADVVSFQQGAGGYTSALDTFIQEDPASVDTDNSAVEASGWDSDDPLGTGFDVYSLIGFDGIIGVALDQVPAGAQITEATLFLTVFNTGGTGTVHEVLADWTDTATFTSFCGASCDEGVEHGPAAALATADSLTTHAINVTGSIQAWADGGTNRGWIIRPAEVGGNDGVDFRSSEYVGDISLRPKLVVRFNEGPPSAAALVRHPYLQLGTSNSMTVVWRTDVATDSRVRYGTTEGVLNQEVILTGVVTDHIVRIDSLAANTKYFYDVGSGSSVQGGATADHYFVTAPTPGLATPFRAWIVGDSGNGTPTQISVKDAMLVETGSTPPDILIHLGDIAYTTGTDSQFTNNHFWPFRDVLRHMVMWPTLGNHEANSVDTAAQTGPYYDAFVLPKAAEAGGVASGTEAYYSYDYGNVHFIVLDSMDSDRTLGSTMLTWLADDLAATSAQWLIASWHHPPYTKGTHNSDLSSDSGGRMGDMRENVLPILEAAGVDLVLCGHSHIYERSYLIDGAHGYGSAPDFPTPNFATLDGNGNIIDSNDGDPLGDGPYLKTPGQNANEGAVYVVAGHGAQSVGGTGGHPVMFFSELSNGSCLLDVTENTLTVRNVRIDGVVSDTVQIMKGALPPRVLTVAPTRGATLNELTQISVTFTKEVSGVTAGDLQVNGSPVFSVAGSGAGPYTFTGFIVPLSGPVAVTLAAGSVEDLTNTPFEGDSWVYTIDTTPPFVASEMPPRNDTLLVLPAISVTFSKPVSGVEAGNLSVDGSPAASVSGVDGTAGPYTFSGFTPPSPGVVSIALASGVIQDTFGQAFAGDSWAYEYLEPLVINEILALNTTVNSDGQGDFDEWIEIHNPSAITVNLAGMFLTNSLAFPTQFEIPSGMTIDPGGYQLFWCDASPTDGDDHTNFTLSSGGGEIGLYDLSATGIVPVDSLTYGAQSTDQSWGLLPDGSVLSVFFPVPTPGATNALTCVDTSDCVQLTDGCNTGVCLSNECRRAASNEGGACDDGIACTDSELCASGQCVGSDSCPGGAACNLFSGLCQGGRLRTATFREGLDGYVGTLDTFIEFAAPDTVNGALERFEWDGSDGSPAGPVYGLLTFHDIFGNSPNQVPAGSDIVFATLTYTIGGLASAVGGTGELHEVLVPWDEFVSYNTFGGVAGAIAGVDFGGGVVAAAGGSPVGPVDIDVTVSVAAWSSDPASNNGWIFIPTDSDGVQVRSSEYVSAPGERPMLTVQFDAGGCIDNAECDDGLYCNGAETCNVGVCEPGTDPCSPSLCDEIDQVCTDALLTCQLLSTGVQPGESVTLELFVQDIADLRGYQTGLSIMQTSGTGSVSLSCPDGLVVDESRSDFVFFGLTDIFSVVDCAAGEAGVSLLGSGVVVGSTPEYLSEYLLNVSADAAPGSEFEINLAVSPGTALVDSGGLPDPFSIGNACTLVIQPCDDGDACTTDSFNGSACEFADSTPVGQCCNSSTGTLIAIDDGDACTTDTCNADGSVDHTQTAQISVSVELDAVSRPIKRDVTFTITDCDTGDVDERTVEINFNGNGKGSVLLSGVNGNADSISAVEGHTLRRLLPLTFTGCAATVSFEDADELLSGDFHASVITKDNLVDIVDFSILSAQWNTMIDPSLSEGADANADGLQGTADFTAIQINFLNLGDPIDVCITAGQTRPAPPLTSVDANELEERVGIQADFNGDGIVDVLDIQTFATQHHLALHPEFINKLKQLHEVGMSPVEPYPSSRASKTRRASR